MLKTLLHYKAILVTVLGAVLVFGGGALADPAIAAFIANHPAADTVIVLAIHVLRVLEQTLTGSAQA